MDQFLNQHQHRRRRRHGNDAGESLTQLVLISISVKTKGLPGDMLCMWRVSKVVPFREERRPSSIHRVRTTWGGGGTARRHSSAATRRIHIQCRRQIWIRSIHPFTCNLGDFLGNVLKQLSDLVQRTYSVNRHVTRNLSKRWGREACDLSQDRPGAIWTCVAVPNNNIIRNCISI